MHCHVRSQGNKRQIFHLSKKYLYLEASESMTRSIGRNLYINDAFRPCTLATHQHHNCQRCRFLCITQQLPLCQCLVHQDLHSNIFKIYNFLDSYKQSCILGNCIVPIHQYCPLSSKNSSKLP